MSDVLVYGNGLPLRSLEPTIVILLSFEALSLLLFRDLKNELNPLIVFVSK